MKNPKDLDDPRRRLLVEALTVGALTSGAPFGNAFAQGIFDSRPQKLPPGQSIYRIIGTASINGKPADLTSRVQPGDTVETGANSEIIFIVGGHSMILRSDTRLVISGKRAEAGLAAAVISGLRLLAGKLLSVSRNAPMRVNTTVATIGIRGTGFYVEADPEKTYFCTCYGQTELAATADPSVRTSVQATHHDRPLYIVGQPGGRVAIRDASVLNHTDQELTLIEALVGRTPPFAADGYPPRREY